MTTTKEHNSASAVPQCRRKTGKDTHLRNVAKNIKKVKQMTICNAICFAAVDFVALLLVVVGVLASMETDTKNKTNKTRNEREHGV